MSARNQHIVTDDLSASLDGMVDDRVRAGVEGHLATCADCRAELAELRATVRLLQSLPVPAPRRSFQLGPEHARPDPPKGMILTLLPVVRAISVAAAIALLVVSGAFLFDSSGTDRTGTIVFSETTSEPARSAAEAPAPPANAAETGGDSALTADESDANAPMAGAAEAEEPQESAAASGDLGNAAASSEGGSLAQSELPATSQPAPAPDSSVQDQAAASNDTDIPWGAIAAWLAVATAALGALWVVLAQLARSRQRTGT